MPSQINPPPAYLRVLQADLHQFTTTILTRLEQVEEAKAELYEAQTWLSSVHTSQPKYSFHLPFQPSSRPSRTPQNQKPFVGSNPSTPFFYRRAHSTAHPLSFHSPLTNSFNMSIKNQNRFQVLSEDIENEEQPQLDMDTTSVLQGEQSQHDMDTTSMVNIHTQPKSRTEKRAGMTT
jgi:hypothetical protein